MTKKLYVSTKNTLSCIDLVTDKILWEKPLPSDLLNITPDGKELYQPVLAANGAFSMPIAARFSDSSKLRIAACTMP